MLMMEPLKVVASNRRVWYNLLIPEERTGWNYVRLALRFNNFCELFNSRLQVQTVITHWPFEITRLMKYRNWLFSEGRK